MSDFLAGLIKALRSQPQPFSPESAAQMEAVAGNLMGLGVIKPHRLVGILRGEPPGIYHATSLENARDIRTQGLQPHPPWHGTDQAAWPDASTGNRSYFSPSAEHSYQFAPAEGFPMLLRVNPTAAKFARERGTGDLFSTTPIDPKHLEFRSSDGKWHSLEKLE